MEPAAQAMGATLKSHSIVMVTDERVDPKWHGTWFEPGFNWATGSGTFAEMITGRAHVQNLTREEAARSLGFHHATEDEWAFVIGLVVCDMAERRDF